MTIFQASKVLKENAPCRPYMFMLTDMSRKIDDNTLTTFIRSVTTTRKEYVIKFICDEKNKVWYYLKNNPDFKLSWLDRTGKPISSVIVTGNVIDMYIEKIDHAATSYPLIGVCILKRK
jgi:hypothetical protein